MNTMNLAQRFSDLWLCCATSDAPPGPVWEVVQRHYCEPHRFYHTLDHLRQCLAELDAATGQVEDPEGTEMAIWFHDIIYHYGAKDNETLSAAAFRNMAGPHLPEDFCERVCEFIIATQHTGAAQDSGIAFLVDIDLSGFGLPWDKYLADSDALRQEAGNVSDAQYYQGKLRFLTELQQWPSVFQTDYFRDRLESTARANIARYSADLRAQGFGQDTTRQT